MLGVLDSSRVESSALVWSLAPDESSALSLARPADELYTKCDYFQCGNSDDFSFIQNKVLAVKPNRYSRARR